MADEVERQAKNIKVVRLANDDEAVFEENIQKYFGEYLK